MARSALLALFTIAAAVPLIACGPTRDDSGTDAGRAPDSGALTQPDAGRRDAGPPDPCTIGTRMYDPAGSCMPSDPCRDDTRCAAEHRICLNEQGIAVCGRCLDGFAETTDECTQEALDQRTTRFRVGRDYFWIWDGARYQRHRVRGVNLGGSIPGTGPGGSYSIPQEQYTRWLSMMAAGGLNTIRVYSLQAPALYTALDAFNDAHPESPIYLIQGIWLDDSQEGLDLHQLTDRFDVAIERTVSALHGEGPGYEADASEWVLGWLIGREVFAGEVLRTDERYAEETSYEGETLRLAQGSPSAVWVAERLDRLIVTEQNRWGESRPVAFSSWMELDPLDHPTESSNTRKDVTSLDLSQIDTFGAPAGHFISYHVYPYYPLFVSEDPIYRTYADEQGPNAYRGLLLRLRDYYRDLPVLVAEYGVPSSWGRAQASFSGMHHGGLTEVEQGRALARMARDIEQTRFAGGVAFQWQDGWWKPTWITNPRTFPRDRYSIWHDLTTPQQSYGLIAFEPPPVTARSVIAAPSDGSAVRDVRMAADARALHIEIDLTEPMAHTSFTIGFDTYRDDLGDSQLPDGTETTIRSELALTVDAGRADLHVIEEYDLLDIREMPLGAVFQSVARDGGAWLPIVWRMTNDHESDDGAYFFEAQTFTVGELRARRSDEPSSSMDAVVIGPSRIDITLPWVLLAYADPSSRTVVHDDPSTDGIDGEVSEGIRLAISIGSTLVETERFSWETWDTAPTTTERVKASAQIFFDALAAM